MWARAIMGIIGMAMVIGFFSVPLLKLKSVALGAVLLVSVAMMVYEFIESLREES